MILDEAHDAAKPAGGPTLDDLFRRALERHPDAVALTDPPNRTSFTDGAPRHLTWAQADRAISAVADRIAGLRLPADAVVALQLPNIVESVIALLGVLRAGMIAAPLPLLWRRRDAAAALGRVAAQAIVTCRRVGPADHGELAMHIAADTFSIRAVGAFGPHDLDGVVALDDAFDGTAETSAPVSRVGDPAAHVAVVTFEATGDGLIPVARNHDELIVAGIAVALESRIGRDATMLGALTTSSFAGLATTIIPWLVNGGTLMLHQPFDPSVFASQCAQGCTAAVLPAPLATRLAEAGLLTRSRCDTVVAVWRAPERLAGAERWSGAAGLVDVLCFGEIGLTAMRREPGAKPSAILPGPVTAPRHKAGAPTVLTIGRGASGTIILGGAMVPRHAFPPGGARDAGPGLKAGRDGTIDTGFACRLDRAGMLVVDAPPPGTVAVGGYRFALRELQDCVAHAAEGASLAALPDALAGQRLAGIAADRNAIRDALVALGANPLVVAAFGERRGERASAA